MGKRIRRLRRFPFQLTNCRASASFVSVHLGFLAPIALVNVCAKPTEQQAVTTGGQGQVHALANLDLVDPLVTKSCLGKQGHGVNVGLAVHQKALSRAGLDVSGAQGSLLIATNGHALEKSLIQQEVACRPHAHVRRILPKCLMEMSCVAEAFAQVLRVAQTALAFAKWDSTSMERTSAHREDGCRGLAASRMELL